MFVCLGLVFLFVFRNGEHIPSCQALPTHPTMSEHIRCRNQLPVKQTLPVSTPEVPLQVAGRRSKSICSHAPLPRRKEKLQEHRCRRHSEATQGPGSCCTPLSVAVHSSSLKPLFPRLQVPEARLSQRAWQWAEPLNWAFTTVDRIDLN